MIAEWKAWIAEGVIAEAGCTREQFEKIWPKHEVEFCARETTYTSAVVARYLREGVLIPSDN